MSQAPVAQRALSLIDHFAEHLSHHGDVRRAAAQLGKSASWGNAMLQRMRQRLGPQAR